MAYTTEYLKMQINQLEYLIISLTNKISTYKKTHKPKEKLYSYEWAKLENNHPHVIYIKTVMSMENEIHKRKNKLNHFKNLLKLCL